MKFRLSIWHMPSIIAAAAIVGFVAMVAFLPPARAQSTIKATTSLAIVIATGNTYQTLVAGGPKFSLEIQNNNATDACLIIIGGNFLPGDTTATSRTVNGASMTAAQASVRLVAGQSFTRYAPYIPSDTILGTCTTAGDSIYADVQR